MISMDIGVWIAALLTIGITSLAFKDNPMSKWAEHTWLGSYAAYFVVISIKNIVDLGLTPLSRGGIDVLIPIVLGLLLYARYSKGYLWVSRYPTAMMVGIGTGVTMRGFLEAQFLDQIRATIMMPLITPDPMTNINNLIFLLTVIICLLYFVFTVNPVQTYIANRTNTIARLIMMAAFGASFANTVVSRVGQYSGRLTFLLFTWLGLG